ncbi:unnamed protein product [Owenia fusiformis]|uniref:Uncharacterized protein n=1 Tax=Owenia fusiformis TaxID=6347 RepID=A0A8S4P8X7_OWEFU|nr:unnamed protein product [Owenia fusiformis]
MCIAKRETKSHCIYYYTFDPHSRSEDGTIYELGAATTCISRSLDSILKLIWLTAGSMVESVGDKTIVSQTPFSVEGITLYEIDTAGKGARKNTSKAIEDLHSNIQAKTGLFRANSKCKQEKVETF